MAAKAPEHKPVVMLAETWSEKHARWPLWAEPKLDGYRFQLMYNGVSTGIVVQRSGVDYTERLGFIAEQLAEQANRLYPGGVMIDGEAFCESWNKTTTLVKTEDPEMDRSALMFYAFDLVPCDASDSGEPEMPLHERKDNLRELLEASGAANIALTPHIAVDDDSQVEKVFDVFLEHGFEGAMLKDPMGVYVGRRSRAWMKRKPWTSSDGRIKGYQEGTRRLQGTLGALILEMADGSEVEVGTGFTDEQRHEIWNNREGHLGRWIEFKHQRDPTAVATYRFPVYLRHRCDLDEAQASA